MNLREPLLRGIYDYGFERPVDVQQHALKPCISSYNAIVQVQSGTSKTIIFIIAISRQLDVNCKDCQTLILVSKRELAKRIHRVVLALGEHINVTCHACIGCVNIREDIKHLEAGVQVVVGTPMVGSMIFVLDETAELLSRGFKNKIYDVLTILSGSFQAIVVLATMPCGLLEITGEFKIYPVKILIKKEERTLEGIRQFYVNVSQ
ncbi:unnamed protein product [Rotaria sp. Silwood1]|nr:unnamed protein product [Rotaria sp. Silwood1]